MAWGTRWKRAKWPVKTHSKEEAALQLGRAAVSRKVQ